MKSTADELVDDYLERLDRELEGFPRSRRRELVEEIAGHIAEARADLESENEAAIRTLLDRLGDPAEIATEAGGEPQPAYRRARGRDVAALILLPIGGVVVPVLGWIVGVVLLWVSDAWNTRDKVLGTLILPGGLLVPLGFLVLGSSDGACVEIMSGNGPTTARTCSYESGTNWGLVALVILLLLAPLATTAYLARRMGRLVVAAG